MPVLSQLRPRRLAAAALAAVTALAVTVRRPGHPRLLRRDSHKNGTFWAMPDNGFGTKENSADFRLRIYLVKPRWERAGGSSGSIQILRYIELSDPRNKIDFPIVNENTRARLLTGKDFDIESLQRMADGSFWIGEEFGPFLLHVDSRGRVLSAPISLPLGKSPQHPTLGTETPNTQRSGGFEAMAASPNGRYLYPILEKGLVDDSDLRRRIIVEFDPGPSATPAAPGPTGPTPTSTWSPTRS